MTELAKGKRYRVTFEGVHTDTDHKDGWARLSVGAGRAAWVPPGATFEPLPEPLKVGDVIQGHDAYAALPVGAVVEDGKNRLMRTSKGFRESEGDFHREPGFFGSPRVLVHLPEGSA